MRLFVSSLCLFLARVQAEHLVSLPGDSQFHAQDVLGQYSYGYSGGPSAKIESRTADGITRGGYSYIDANGILQSVNYVSDPINGFRVAATNLPQAPLPEAVKTVEPLPTVKFTSADIKTVPENIPAINFAAITNPLYGVNLLPELQLHSLPTLKFTPEEQKLASVATPEEPKASLPIVKAVNEEPKLTSEPDVRPSVISVAPALKLTPLTVPAYNLSPFAFTHPGTYVTYVSPDLYQSYAPLVSQPLVSKPDLKSEAGVVNDAGKSESATKERAKRDVYYSPAVLAILRSRHQHLVRDKFGNLVFAYPQPVAALGDVKPLGNPAYIY